jgi:DNA repair protein RecO (recombination protein O)
MEWSAPAIVLSAKRHGEGHAVLDVLCDDHGRARGYVRGGGSRKQRPVLETGNLVAVTWRGRLDEHLGSFRVEPVKSVAPALYRHPARLAGLAAFAQLLLAVLPERDPCPEIYGESLRLLEHLANLDEDDLFWGAEMVKLEAMLLSRLGFGLDLASCAATGKTEGLAYVSPNTGRAVTAEAGKPYAEKLLPLPGFLTTALPPTREGVRDGFALTGFFIARHVLHDPHPALETARARMVDYFS